MTDDFNGDRQTYFFIRFKIGKNPNCGFMLLLKKAKITNHQKSLPILPMVFGVIRFQSSKRKNASFRQGEEDSGPNLKLKTDAVTQYICETAGAITHIYKNKKFKIKPNSDTFLKTPRMTFLFRQIRCSFS